MHKTLKDKCSCFLDFFHIMVNKQRATFEKGVAVGPQQERRSQQDDWQLYYTTETLRWWTVCQSKGLGPVTLWKKQVTVTMWSSEVTLWPSHYSANGIIPQEVKGQDESISRKHKRWAMGWKWFSHVQSSFLSLLKQHGLTALWMLDLGMILQGSDLWHLYCLQISRCSRPAPAPWMSICSPCF